MRLMLLSSIVMVLASFPMSALAGVKVERVEYKHGDVVLEGVLAYDDASPDATSKRPGVLVCHEWWGCNDYAVGRAKQLAGMGYIAFALDMYGKGVNTEDPKKAGELAGKLYGDPAAARERAMLGLRVLADHKLCDPKRVAAIGYCMGGTVALELARTGSEVAAVVCFHTSTIAAKEPADNAKIKGKVLVCHGAEDGFVTPEQIEGFRTQMKDAKIDYKFVSYAGAVHSFTNKGADRFNIPGVKYQEAADRRSWEDMRQWFRETLGSK